MHSIAHHSAPNKRHVTNFEDSATGWKATAIAIFVTSIVSNCFQLYRKQPKHGHVHVTSASQQREERAYSYAKRFRKALQALTVSRQQNGVPMLSAYTVRGVPMLSANQQRCWKL